MPLHYGLIGHPLGTACRRSSTSRLFALQGREGSYTLQDLEPLPPEGGAAGPAGADGGAQRDHPL